MKEEHLVQLATCANDITLALEKIWQELGLNQEEEEQKLMKEAHTFFENKYQQFQQTILDYQQKILTLQEEIQHTRQILHQDMSSHQVSDQSF
jgi:alpha/beta superfamily hydrolase